MAKTSYFLMTTSNITINIKFQRTQEILSSSLSTLAFLNRESGRPVPKRPSPQHIHTRHGIMPEKCFSLPSDHGWDSRKR